MLKETRVLGCSQERSDVERNRRERAIYMYILNSTLTNSRLMQNCEYDHKMEHKFVHNVFGSQVFARKVIKPQAPQTNVLKLVFKFVVTVGRRESISMYLYK